MNLFLLSAFRGRASVPWPLRLHGWQRAFKRATYVLLGAATGCGLAWVAGGDLIDEHLQMARSVDALTGQLTAGGPIASVPTGAVAGAVSGDAPLLSEELSALTERLPGQRSVARVWPDLQQVLTQHGLRVASLRPLPEPLAAPLPSQSVAVRMTGRFADWQRAWAALCAAGPVWSMERISVVPQPAVAGVQIDVVLRVWLRPGLDGPEAWPAVTLPPERVGAAAPALPEIFAQTLAGMGPGAPTASPALLAASSAGPMSAVLSSDPLQWPMARMRLAGLWQQGHVRQAVLVAGPYAVRVGPGQRVAQEGLRVEAVTTDSVRLRSPQGALHVLNLEGGPR
jgi:hypothetical protein